MFEIVNTVVSSGTEIGANTGTSCLAGSALLCAMLLGFFS